MTRPAHKIPTVNNTDETYFAAPDRLLSNNGRRGKMMTISIVMPKANGLPYRWYAFEITKTIKIQINRVITAIDVHSGKDILLIYMIFVLTAHDEGLH